MIDKKIILHIMLFVIAYSSTNISLLAHGKDELFAALRKRYGTMKTLEAQFMSIEPVSGIGGVLKAERSGKYSIALTDRQVVCDGKTLWNYTPSKKSVTITSIKNKPATSLDIVLFTFLFSYQPMGVQQFTIGGQNYTALELSPKTGMTTMGIKSLKVFVKKGNNIITRISASDGNQEQVWDIKSIKVNAGIDEHSFTFQPPDKAEIIDLR